MIPLLAVQTYDMQRNLAPKTPSKPESDETDQNRIPALEPPAQDIIGNFVQNNGEV